MLERKAMECIHPTQSRVIDTREGTVVCTDCSFVVLDQIYVEETEKFALSSTVVTNIDNNDDEVVSRPMDDDYTKYTDLANEITMTEAFSHSNKMSSHQRSSSEKICETVSLDEKTRTGSQAKVISSFPSTSTSVSTITTKQNSTMPISTSFPHLLPTESSKKYIRKEIGTRVTARDREILTDNIVNGNLPMSLYTSALKLFSSAIDGGAGRIKKGKCNRRALLAYSLYTACRLLDECSRSVREIAILTGVSAKIIWSVDELFVYRPPRNLFRNKSLGALMRTATELQLSKQDIIHLRNIIENVSDYTTKGPRVFVAALVRSFSILKGKSCSSAPYRRPSYLGQIFGLSVSTIVAAASDMLRDFRFQKSFRGELMKTVSNNDEKLGKKTKKTRRIEWK